MYRKIESKFWTDPKVKSLDCQERLLFLYLITNPHSHVSGIYYLPLATMHHECGLEAHQVSRSLKALLDRQLVFYDEITEVVWVKRMLRYQGMTPKIIISVTNHLYNLHNSCLIKAFIVEYQNLKIPYQYSTDTVPIPEPKLPLQAVAVEVAGTGSGNKQLQEKEKECEEKGKPIVNRGVLSMPEFEKEDSERIRARKDLLRQQARKLGVEA